MKFNVIVSNLTDVVTDDPVTIWLGEDSQGRPALMASKGDARSTILSIMNDGTFMLYPHVNQLLGFKTTSSGKIMQHEG